jgi:hypothetical protein
MDDFAHNNTDVCCLAAFAHWQGEDHLAIFLLSELCYALNVCRRRVQKLSVLACFPF